METQPSPVAKAFVAFYIFVHGRLHLRGAGALIRFTARYLPGLQAYPYSLQDVGTATLDFRDTAVFGLLNYSLGECRSSERCLLTAMAQMLRPGDVLWDVGANVGYVSQHFARPEFQLASIQAFEPNPVPLKPLLSLFDKHPRVRVHPFGLGSREETAQLSVISTGSEIASLKRNLKGAQTVPVPIRRGDDVATELNLPLPNVVKIDVEGFEDQVFEGMQRTISKTRPVIFFEHIWMDDETMCRLRPPDYELVFLLDDGTRTRDFALRRGGANGIFLPVEKTHAPIEG